MNHLVWLIFREDSFHSGLSGIFEDFDEAVNQARALALADPFRQTNTVRYSIAGLGLNQLAEVSRGGKPIPPASTLDILCGRGGIFAENFVST